MKKRYITPFTEAISIMARNYLLLPASENGYTDENLSRHYNQDDNVWDINGED